MTVQDRTRPTMPTRYWTIRPAQPNEAPAILELARAVHGFQRPELNDSFLSWRYWNDTPFRADILVAEHEGRFIGMQPVAVFDFQQGSERFKGAMYTGVQTHPDHRRRGVFRSLIDSSNAYAAERGAAFCLTMPNDDALAGFSAFGDWHYPGPIPTSFKIIKRAALLRGGAAGAFIALAGSLPQAVFARRRGSSPNNRYSCVCSDTPADNLDDLADESAREFGGVCLRRTSAYWNWRYAVRPAASYRPTAAVSPAYRTLVLKEGTQPVGAVATSVAHQAGLDVGLIVDLVARGGLPVLRRLLFEAEAELRDRGVGLITCQATHPAMQTALKEEGHLLPNPRWLPRKFNFVYRPTDRRLPGGLALTDWHLTFGDSDNT
jgi:GNAT superfamily N-acetyltransferase